MKPWVSLSGPDDKVRVTELRALCSSYPAIKLEYGVLYFPEKEGLARYPSAQWRQKLAAENLPCTVTAHLCGKQVFQDILAGEPSRIRDLLRYSRLQVNINARHQIFTESEVFRIYDRLIERGARLILQYHAGSEQTIKRYLASRGLTACTACDVLFDSSKGTGVSPEAWPVPLAGGLGRTSFGYAGGLGPETVRQAWPRICAATSDQERFWVDMESGIRTGNEFDLEKVRTVLSTISAIAK